MRYKIRTTSTFRADVKLAVRRGEDMEVLDDIVTALAAGERLPVRCKDHALRGKWRGHRECHIAPDRLLVYRKIDRVLVLVLVSTGSHSDIFKK